MLVLNLRSEDEWLTSAPAVLPPGKELRHPKNGRLGGPPRAGLDVLEKRKKLLPHTRDLNPGSSSQYTVDIPTTPPRLPVVNGLENDRYQDKIHRRHDVLTLSNSLALSVRQLGENASAAERLFKLTFYLLNIH